MLLRILGVTCGYGAHPVLQDATVLIHKEDMVGIVGPNGSGKSTLLRTMSRVLRPSLGKVLFEEADLYQIPAQIVAKRIAVVSQEQGLNFPFSVEDVVMMGRTPHIKRFQRETSSDREVVQRVMELTDITFLAHRPVNELSGGEKQRVLIARALAQEPSVLLLDEPTSYLDINYQLEIMELLVRLHRDQGITIVMVLHDINLASQFCNSLLVVKEGKIYAAGTPQQVITSDFIKDIYGCDVRVESQAPGGRPIIILSKARPAQKSEMLGRQVHVVGGGGASTELFQYLVDRGWGVSTGVVNIGDSDWHEALRLGISIVEAAPFCEVSEVEAIRNHELMNKAEYIVLAGIPFGSGNIRNLEVVLEEAQKGRKVIVVNKLNINERDYTGGVATKLYNNLISCGVSVVENEREAISLMEGGG